MKIQSIALIAFIYIPIILNSVKAQETEILTKTTETIINSSILSGESPLVIVGFKTNTSTTSAVGKQSPQVLKSSFLESNTVSTGLKNKSMIVENELLHFPFIILRLNNLDGFQILKEHQGISSIEADKAYKMNLKTSVPKLVGVTNPWGGSYYNGQGSWVAVLDSGVNTSHPMFQGKSIVQACFTTDSSCPNGNGTQYGGNAADPMGKSDHGTHVAGIAVGNYIASKQLGGVAPNANLIAVQVFDNDDSAYYSSLISALNFVYGQAASKRVAAANMSLGGGSYTSSCDGDTPTMASAIQLLRDRKVATVVAAGNNYSDISINFPACISSSIAVASATKSYNISNFSSRNNMVSLIAPGSSIKSAGYGSSYPVKSGTSMASPMIAGAFAVMRKLDSNATVSAIEGALQGASRTVKDNLITGDDYFHFWPLLNKARLQIGGTNKPTSSVGFNTTTSIDRFNKISNTNWHTNTGHTEEVNGVAYNYGTEDKWSGLLFPEVVLTGRVSAKLKFKNSSIYSYGITARAGGTSEYTDNTAGFHDGYYLAATNLGEYSVWKAEHGIETGLVPWTQNSSIVNTNNWNVFLITTGGKTAKFFINGNLIGQHTSERLIYGASGITSYDGDGDGVIYADWFFNKSNNKSSGYHSLASSMPKYRSTPIYSSGGTSSTPANPNDKDSTPEVGCPETPIQSECENITIRNSYILK